ncbi:MAG: LamG domain-containing protein, partial [Polyangiaceae bacterium]
MKSLGLCGCSLVVLVSGCGNALSGPSEGEPVQRAMQSLSSASAVLGFESATAWQGLGSLTLSTEHTEGNSSLAVQPQGYVLYASDRVAFPAEVRSIALDMKLPAPAPPYWAGAVQLYLDCPTHGVWNSYVGQVELMGLPRDTFTTLTFALSSALRTQLASGCEQMELRLALNVPLTLPAQSYLLDNLRLRGPLQLHYTCDALTADGRVRDVSGYDRHGVLKGAAALGAGRMGSGLSLDGVSGYVEVPDSLTEGIQELTIASWIKLDAQTGWSRLFDFGGSAGFAYFTPYTFDGTLRYSAYAGYGIEGTLTAPAIPAGPWKHVAITTRGRDYRLYVDGVEAANALTVPTTPANIGTNNGGNWIGRSRFSDPLLKGTIDDFRVYDRVLSQSEIQALAAPGSDYANWRFDETTASGAIAKDSSDLHLDGQITGAVSHVPGVVNGALSLDGLGGHVELPTGLVQTCADFTLTSWVKLRQNPPWNRVFDFGKPDLSSFMYLTPAGFGAQGQEMHFG